MSKSFWLAAGSLVAAITAAGAGGWAYHNLQQERDALVAELTLVTSEVDQLVADAEAAQLTQEEIDAFAAQLAAGQEALDEVQRVADATFDLGTPSIGPTLESRIGQLESDVDSICRALLFNTDLILTC